MTSLPQHSVVSFFRNICHISFDRLFFVSEKKEKSYCSTFNIILAQLLLLVIAYLISTTHLTYKFRFDL